MSEQPENTPKVDALEKAFGGASLEEWKDIRMDLEAASEELKVGELLQRPGFIINHAMLSIEMMDPKMDAGVVAGQSLPFDERLSKGLVPLDLSDDQVIALMDEILCLETAYYDGLPVAQTVFTCLYLHETSIIRNRHLKAFCDGLLLTCEKVSALIKSARVYEEEDFVDYMFGFNFSSVPSAEASAALNRVDEEEVGEIKKLKFKKSESETEEAEIQKIIAYKEGILARIRFRRALNNIFSLVEAFEHRKIENIKKAITFALVQIPIIRSSRLTVPLPSGIIDSAINFRQLGASPLKEIRKKSFEDSLVFFNNMLQNIQRSLHLVTLSSLHEISDFFVFVISQIPDVITRSITAIIWVPNSRNKLAFGKVPLSTLVTNDMSIMRLPKDITENEHTKAFIEKASMDILVLFRILCNNRGRIRRKLVNHIDRWVNLQDDALKADELLAPLKSRFEEPLSVWTARYTVFISKLITTLGYELELYHPSEMVFMSWWAEHVCRSDTHLYSIIYPETAQPSNPSEVTKKKKEKRNQEEPAPVNVTISSLFTEALQFYYQTYVHLTNAILADPRNKSSRPEAKYGSLEKNFEYRMNPFSRLRFPLMEGIQQYHNFMKIRNKEAIELYLYALESLTMCKSTLEKLKKHTALFLPEMSSQFEQIRKCEILMRLNLTKIMSPQTSAINSTRDTYPYHRCLPVINFD